MRVNAEKLICSACLAVTATAVASSSHQPITNVANNGGDVRVEYIQPYSGWGKLISLSCVVGSGVMLTLGLKSVTASVNKPSPQVVAAAIPQRQTLGSHQVESFNNSVAIQQEENFSTVEALVPNPEPTQRTLSTTQPVDRSDEFFHLLYTHKKKHTFFPAETGAGKTTALLGAIDYIHRVNEEAIFLGSTAKPTAWGGLENLIWEEDKQTCVIDISNDDIESIRKFYERLVCINKLMEARQKQRQQCEKNNLPYSPPPIYIIIDEWLRTLGIAENYDKKAKPRKAKREILSQQSKTILLD